MAMTRAMTPALLALVLVLVTSAGAAAQEPDKGKDKGKAVYVTHCQECHGPDASGGQGPPLVNFDVDLSEFTTLVRQGVGLMPPFPRSKIEDEQIAELHAYLSSLNKSHANGLSRAIALPTIDAHARHRRTSSRVPPRQDSRE